MRGRPYSDDFSTATDVQVRGDFMHEMTHIWQNQHGKNTSDLIVLHGLQGQAVYDLSGLGPDSIWNDVNGERQGEIVKNIYILQNGGTVTNGNLSLQQYQDILSRTPWHTQAPMEPIKPVPGEVPECFVRGTPILLADGSSKPIEQVQPGDLVLAFAGRTALQPRRVVRLFENATTELLELTPAPGHRRDAEDVGFGTLTVTRGHSFLTADGTFEEIGKTIHQSQLSGMPAQIVLASGATIAVYAKLIRWASNIEDRYEQSEVLDYSSDGNAALAPKIQ
jgi:hypothetical protein